MVPPILPDLILLLLLIHPLYLVEVLVDEADIANIEINQSADVFAVAYPDPSIKRTRAEYSYLLRSDLAIVRD